MDCGGGEAETGKHPPPVHSGGICKDGSKGLLAYTTTAEEHVTVLFLPLYICIKMPPCGLASFRGLGLLARLAKVAGMTVYSIRSAADKMGI